MGLATSAWRRRSGRQATAPTPMTIAATDAAFPREAHPATWPTAIAWNRIVEDAHGVNREIAKRHRGVPIIALGHSMGSFVLQQLLFEHPDDMVAAALSASNGKPPPIATLGKLVARLERLRVGKRKPSPILQKLTFERLQQGVRSDSNRVRLAVPRPERSRQVRRRPASRFRSVDAGLARHARRARPNRQAKQRREGSEGYATLPLCR